MEEEPKKLKPLDQEDSGKKPFEDELVGALLRFAVVMGKTLKTRDNVFITSELHEKRHHRRPQTSLPTLFQTTPQAAEGFLNFFTAAIRNPHTRRAYLHVVAGFAAWYQRRTNTTAPFRW